MGDQARNRQPLVWKDREYSCDLNGSMQHLDGLSDGIARACLISITRAEFPFLLSLLVLVQLQITIEANHRKTLSFEPLPLENGGVASIG